MADYIIRATAADNQIRVFFAATKDVVEEARKRHYLSPVATAALGRLLTAGAMMGSMMKGEKDLLTLRIQCSGPIGGLTVTADQKANVRGYVKNPEVTLPPNGKGKLDVGGALDTGTLSVIKDIGMKEPYIGQTQLVSGEVAEDLTYYFANSEQTPSSVALGVLLNEDATVKRAGGFIIQLMPFVEEETIQRLERKINSLEPITTILDREDIPEKALESIMGDFGLRVLERVPTRFSCNCTKERVKKVLACLKKAELEEMVTEGEPIETHCHFCNTDYTFSIDEIKMILSSL